MQVNKRQSYLFLEHATWIGQLIPFAILAHKPTSINNLKYASVFMFFHEYTNYH